MRTLNLRKLLLECGSAPLDESFKVEHQAGSFYRRILPAYCCAWDRGIYFQVTLVEVPLETLSPTHHSKATFCLAGPYPHKTKPIVHLDGTRVDYPVFNFHIIVNRSVFPPWNGQEDKVEWFTKLTGRTKGIAHELLYGAQYVKQFDWASKAVLSPIQIPTVSQEEDLLCPFSEIERLLQSTEKLNGTSFKTEQDFLNAQPTTMVQSYYRTWLENFAVDREMCHDRTLQYLRTNARHPSNTKHLHPALCACMKKHNENELTPLRFKTHVDKATPFCKAFIAEVKQLGAAFPDDDTILWLAAIHIEQSGRIRVS